MSQTNGCDQEMTEDDFLLIELNDEESNKIAQEKLEEAERLKHKEILELENYKGKYRICGKK